MDFLQDFQAILRPWDGTVQVIVENDRIGLVSQLGQTIFTRTECCDLVITQIIQIIGQKGGKHGVIVYNKDIFFHWMLFFRDQDKMTISGSASFFAVLNIQHLPDILYGLPKRSQQISGKSGQAIPCFAFEDLRFQCLGQNCRFIEADQFQLWFQRMYDAV